jgi:leucine dehydrogenase
MIPWQSPEFDRHEQVTAFHDAETGLRAIVAVHSTALGPAVGGTRFWPYAEDRLALDDALRLSRAMSFKCALAGVPFGGGKAVIVGDPARAKSRALLHAYGRCLDRIGATFSTGEDVGFSVADCETVREVTPFVAGTDSAGAGDPSVHTARGVFHGLAAVLEARLARDSFAGVHVAVQGLGNVGWRLCELLHEAGARLTVADLRADRVDAARSRFGATAVPVDAIVAAPADILAPCALGGVIDAASVGTLRVQAVAGAANNQLASEDMAEALADRGILYAPDFVVNAGGVLGAVEEIARLPGRALPALPPLAARLAGIRDRLRDIFARAAAERTTPGAAALRMARELIAAGRAPRSPQPK